MYARFIFAALAVMVSGVSCSRKQEASKLDDVRFSDRGFITNAPVYLADAEGYFTDEGIHLTYVAPSASTSQIMPLLERGTIDVMSGTPSAAFYSLVEKGGKSRMVADRGHVADTGCDYDGVMARRGLFDSAPPTAKSLRGRRFSVSPAGTIAYITDKYLQAVGLTTNDLDLVRMNEFVEAQAIDAGTIDGLHVSEPQLSRLVAAGHKLIGPARIYALGVHHAVLVYGPTLTVEHRDVGVRFMKAYLRGVAKFHEGLSPRTIDIISKKLGMEPAMLKGICLPSINSDGALNMAALLDFQKWAVRNGVLARVAGPEAGIDTTFARTASSELGIKSSQR
jgi:NitT/TauT family transport system substrate-binding protein